MSSDDSEIGVGEDTVREEKDPPEALQTPKMTAITTIVKRCVLF